MAVIIRDSNERCTSSATVYHDDGTVQRIYTEESVYISEERPVDEMLVDVNFNISKSRDDEQLVSGWASVSVNKDGSIPLDWQDDVIIPEELEKAAINFMLESRGSGEMHQGQSKGSVVESIVFTKEKQEVLGIPEGVLPQGWFITVKVHDPEAFAKVKDGTYKMFSIQGTSRRVKI